VPRQALGISRVVRPEPADAWPGDQTLAAAGAGGSLGLRASGLDGAGGGKLFGALCPCCAMAVNFPAGWLIAGSVGLSVALVYRGTLAG